VAAPEQVSIECPCGSDDVAMQRIETSRTKLAVMLYRDSAGNVWADDCGEVESDLIDSEDELDGLLRCRDCGAEGDPDYFVARPRCESCGDPLPDDLDPDLGLTFCPECA
jgi:hypothetical protein